MPSTRRSRTIAAPAEDLWALVRDPYHLPRWWPRVERVEGVEGDEFTEVMRTAKGKVVRADFNVAACDDATRSLTWVQRVEGTPFARVLRSAETEIGLAAVAAGDGPATEVTIELRQVLQGGLPLSRIRPAPPRLGSYLVRRGARRTLEEALDGLERIGGRA